MQAALDLCCLGPQYDDRVGAGSHLAARLFVEVLAAQRGLESVALHLQEWYVTGLDGGWTLVLTLQALG
jgi:hypothetical protein